MGPVLESDRAYSRLWFALWKAIAKAFPKARGVRVFELHPGGHGIHVHAIFTEYLRVERVRSLAYAAGWGRVHVFRPRKSWSRYLAKHLRKTQLGRFARGTRKWAALRFAPNRVRDIRVESDLSWNMKRARAANGGRAIFGAMLDAVVAYTILWGRVQ